MQEAHLNLNTPPPQPPEKSCDECCKVPAVYRCEECDQYICARCDTRIHNKGKRALHERTLLNRNFNKTNFLDPLSDERKALSNDKIFYSDT